MPPPPPITPNQIVSTVSDIVDFMVPLLGAAVVFSQVVGHILKATNPDTGPPPTYYINMPANNPSSPSQPQVQQAGPAVTPVVGLGMDGVGGFMLTGPDHGVLLGSTAQPVAVVGLATVNGAPVLTGNDTILIGPGQLPLAGQGSATPLGPVYDQSPDNVQMQVSMQMQGPPGVHTLYNACGTGGRWDADFTADVAREVNGKGYYWQGVSYPAATFPMGPSAKQGVEEMVRLISQNPGSFAIMGYSQGAIVTCKLWRDEILNPNGRLHDRLNDIFAHVTFGNPMRCPGIANGNALANLPFPANEFGYLTGGIAGPDDLTPWQTPYWHIDFAKNGDLYATCPTGPDPWSNEAPPGEMETGVYKMVQGELMGDESILQQVGEILTNPFGEMVPLILAIADSLQFVGDMGTHAYVECKDAAVKYLIDRGAQVPVT